MTVSNRIGLAFGLGRVLVIDLDRVRRRGAMTRARRLAGLFRFDRYAEGRLHPVSNSPFPWS